MMIREAARAGSFYPAEPDACREEILRCLPDPASLGELPARIVGGIVPHAGWVYSGAVAARTFAAIAARRRPETVVVFGAVHRAMRADAAVFARGAWASPLGEIAIDERLAERLLGACSLVRDEPYAHESEHSIEVQVPFIQHYFPQAKCVPVGVMPGPRAAEIGLAAGRVVRDSGVDAVFIGSTDLTHYGPSYGIVSHGIGAEGLRWARDENDRRMLDLILARDADAIVAEAKAHHNACGSGAVASCIVAANELGATQARLLEHTTSAEVGARFGMGGGADAVGYAAVVFGSDE